MRPDTTRRRITCRCERGFTLFELVLPDHAVDDVQAHVLEQTQGKQGADGRRALVVVVGIAHAERQRGKHSARLDALQAAVLRVKLGYLDGWTAGRDRLIGETEDLPAGGRDGAKATFQQERSGVAAMALGIIEECLQLSVQYAKDRVQFGKPIGEFQLIQDKLARMEVARMNVQNLVFRTMEMSAAGVTMSLAEASAMKLYSARAATEVALEAVQLFGGNGYMSEFRVEQLARDAKVLQIYAGTDEIQITHIAKDLLRS